MKNIFIILGLILITSTSYGAPRQKSTTCTPTVEKENQHRSEMKHRSIPTGTIKPTLVSVTDMLNWDIPKNARGEMSDPRESQVFTVEGYVIHAKLAPDDCDVHMEIAATNDDKAPRVIVEIPNDKGFEEAQKIAVNSQGKKLAITGYPFWDSAHWSKADPKKGHNHGSATVGTLWELHPAWKVELRQ
jgi:hypothetical protein